MDAKSGKKGSAAVGPSTSAPAAEGDVTMTDSEAAPSAGHDYEQYTGQPTGVLSNDYFDRPTPHSNP